MSDTRTRSYLLPPPSMAEASRRWFCCVVAEDITCVALVSPYTDSGMCSVTM